MAYRLPEGTPCTNCANAHETINYMRYCYVWNRPVRDNDPACQELKPREQ